jgi:hypothetical protein
MIFILLKVEIKLLVLSAEVQYSKTSLIQNSVIPRFTVFGFLFELKPQGKKIDTNLLIISKTFIIRNSKEKPAL